MARRPRRSSQPAPTRAASAPVRQAAPRENMPRGTFRVAANLRNLIDAMPNLMTDKSVKAASAARASSSQVRVITAAKSAAAVNRPSDKQVSHRKSDVQPEPQRTPDPRTCKRPPSSNRGSGNGRPFVPWCK